MLRLVHAIGLAGLAFVVSRGADAAGMPAWIGVAGAAGLLLMAVFTATLGPFAPHLKRGLPAGDPLLDRSVVDAVERLRASGRPPPPPARSAQRPTTTPSCAASRTPGS